MRLAFFASIRTGHMFNVTKDDAFIEHEQYGKLSQVVICLGAGKQTCFYSLLQIVL